MTIELVAELMRHLFTADFKQNTFVFHTELFMHEDIIGAKKKKKKEKRVVLSAVLRDLRQEKWGTKAKTDKRLEVR